MALATSYNTVGNREDLTDFLTILEPEQTPVLSSIEKMGKPNASFSEWQVDNLKVPTFPGVLDGQDVTAFENKVQNRARIGNYIQIFREPWAVSQVEELTDVAGVTNEVANAKAKSMLEIKRSMEAAICSDNDMQADNGSSPYLTRGLGSWISSSAQTTNAVPAAYRTPSGAINSTATASLTETQFNSVLQARYEQIGQGGDVQLFAGTALKSAISRFTRSEGAVTAKTYYVNQNATQHQIDLVVDTYISDFGHVEIIPTLFNGVISGDTSITNQRKARGYIIGGGLVGLKTMKALGSQELINEGGGRRGYVDAIIMLCVKNPLGLGKFSATS